MTKVTGLGGVFFKCKDKKALGKWCHEMLGFDIEGGASQTFMWADDKKPAGARYSVWSPFSDDTDYFAPGEARFMINLQVDDLLEMVAELRTKGAELVGGVFDEDYGKFAWVQGPEGNKVELWEAVPLPEE